MEINCEGKKMKETYNKYLQMDEFLQLASALKDLQEKFAYIYRETHCHKIKCMNIVLIIQATPAVVNYCMCK